TLLADFGADVIRIERQGGSEDRTLAPVTDDGEGALFLQLNRNKRSLTLDPRAAGAGEILRRLVAKTDVVVANVPTMALAKMGIDYPTLSEIRADIILANVSCFGPIGPWADRPGFDSVGQAMCGSAYLSGEGDTPYRTPISWVDHATALYTAFGVMVALHERAQTGRGQQINGSLLGSALAFSSNLLIEQAVKGLNRTATGNRSLFNGPTDAFRTTDGWIVTQVVGQPLFKRWVQLMGEPNWLEDPRFATDQLRGDNGALLSERMAAWCATRTSAEALDALGSANIPAGPVLSPQQALDHEQVQAMGILAPTMVAGLDQPAPLMLPPITLGATPADIRLRPPGIGEHTDEILAELSFSEAEREQLKADRAV
ncbi:MAG TPA: CoA transferase, partial [Caulobacteraceae bacterium]|nr:CoA transferase [Caulobacteraceae bacterium]